jgi:uncharacterized membrane protein
MPNAAEELTGLGSRSQETVMDDTKTLVGYSGIYAFTDDAQADFDFIKQAHSNNWIGAYDAALFTKNADGKVKLLNIDATERMAGAIVGVVLGIIFPPSVLIRATVGAAAGAAAGNLAKRFVTGEIKDYGEKLLPGESGILLIADATFDAGAAKLMKRAKRFAKQVVNADAKDMKEALAAM